MPRDDPPPEPEHAAAARLLSELLTTEGQGEAPSGARRLLRSAAAGARTAVGLLGGRLRGRGGGLGALRPEQIEALVRSLGGLKGVAMKMGQIASYVDGSLPPEARQMMTLLQTQSPPSPFASIAAALREDLGPAGAALADALDPVPVSVASIGQVHRGRYQGTDVAVKVRHPGIEAAIRSDFRLAGVGPLFASTVMPSSAESVRQLIAEAQARFLEECDYQGEAAFQQEFAALHAESPDLVIPAVHRSLCSRRILTTTWEPGRSLDAMLAGSPSQAERDRLGEVLFAFYFGTLYRHGLFHADPHPGNYAFRDDGRVVLYDFGCVRRFEPEVVRAFVRLSAAVRDDSEQAVGEALAALGARAPQRPDEKAAVRAILRAFFGPMLVPGRHRIEADRQWDMGGVFQSKMTIGRLSLPGRLLFLFRIRFGLYAVLARLGAEADWQALELGFTTSPPA